MNDCEGAEQQHQLARSDPLSLIDRGRRLSFRDSITTYISFDKKIFDVSPIGFIRNVTDKTGRGGGYLYMLGGRV